MSAPALAAPVTNRRTAELALAVAVVFVIALLMVPLPALLLDLLIAGSIGI